VGAIFLSILLFQTVPSAESVPPPGRLVDVGGWRLRLNCVGERKPAEATVVLEAGGGDFSVTWALVQPKVAAFGRVCSYDRAGSGWSELGPNPRTMRQSVYELHTLLKRAGVPPPYVLVGHSFGGFLVRLYTVSYPTDVAGLVLVDASYEEDLVGFNGKMMRWWEEATGKPIPPAKTSAPMHVSDYSDAVRERANRAAEQCSRVNAPPFDRLPSAAQLARTWACSQPRTHLPGESTFDGDEAAALRAERQNNEYPLDNRPLVVVTRGISGYEREPLAEQRQRERTVHSADLAKLSRHGTQVVAEGSGHQVQIEAPDVVVDAIRNVVSSANRR
jgi:pimeloyl-ACP methyl ester carboxylesterase